MNIKINIFKGDITKVKADAIVNAANTSLLGGGGVDGAIHRAGGSTILEDCRKIRNSQGGCKVGDAVITTAGNLDAKNVIHTVGPRWNSRRSQEEEKLKNCYESCLRIAEENRLSHIAFPSISTGIYKFPKELAAKIAINSINNHKPIFVSQITFVCFDDETFQIYTKWCD